ncbi:MAG: 30S ribosomal protein S17e [archaeon]
MGRIKTQLIKRTSKEIVQKNKNSLTGDYAQNRAKISSMATIRSKKLKNVISGYVTRLMKADKQ